MATSLRGGSPSEVGCDAKFYTEMVSSGVLAGLNMLAIHKGTQALDKVIATVVMATLFAEITKPKMPDFGRGSCDLEPLSITRQWLPQEAIMVTLLIVVPAGRYLKAWWHGRGSEEVRIVYEDGGEDHIAPKKECQQMRETAIRAMILWLGVYLLKSATETAHVV